MKQDFFPVARQRDILVQSIENEVLVYDLKTNKALCLNITSAAIWQFCNGKNSIADIASHFQTQSNQPVPVELVEITLEKLSKENLLENYQPANLMNKKSRREMIRKVGLATAVALPVIASIVAPQAVAAASCAAGETFCPQFFSGIPAGCYDLQNNPAPNSLCGMCNGVCGLIAFPRCVNGACVA